MVDCAHMGNPTNPNGANQYMLDPRQSLCWGYYSNPKSETFGNALRSAIKAGYDDEYANSITAAEWFCGKLRRLNMLRKAEKVLEETLDMDVTESGKKVPALVGIKNDVAKFIAKTQGKNEGYSERHEHTGKDGEELKPATINIINPNDDQLQAEQEAVRGVDAPNG